MSLSAATQEEMLDFSLRGLRKDILKDPTRPYRVAVLDETEAAKGNAVSLYYLVYEPGKRTT